MNAHGKDPCELAEIVYEKPFSGAFAEKLFGSDRSNTLWIKFSDKLGIDEWIGKFGTGIYGSSYVQKITEPDQFFVSASGFGYVVDASRRELLVHHFDENAHGIAYDPKTNRFIVADSTRIRFIETNQVIWTSKTIAVDGIRDFKVEGRIISALATTDYGGRETGFTFDMDTFKIKWNKPWWRFWS
jgi:hypothetical protein